MKTMQKSGTQGGKLLLLAAFMLMGFHSVAADGKISKAFFNDFMGSGSVGFYIIGGILVGGIVLHIIVNHMIKPKDEESKRSQMPASHQNHHHRHHHHPHRVVKKTS
ncbi:MAG: hypothetical protein JST26_17225 [Bacteroidetes bacterium]|nr:hypothetical protein [Bacteroidota bacterium]